MARVALKMKDPVKNVFSRFPFKAGRRRYKFIVPAGYLAIINGDDVLEGGEKMVYSGGSIKIFDAVMFRQSIDSKSRTEVVNQLTDITLFGEVHLLGKEKKRYAIISHPVFEIRDFVAFAHHFPDYAELSKKEAEAEIDLELRPIINAALQAIAKTLIDEGMEKELAERKLDELKRRVLATADVESALNNRGLILRPESFNMFFKDVEDLDYDPEPSFDKHIDRVCPHCGGKISPTYTGRYCNHCGSKL